jgi:hypothetical protein
MELVSQQTKSYGRGKEEILVHQYQTQKRRNKNAPHNLNQPASLLIFLGIQFFLPLSPTFTIVQDTSHKHEIRCTHEPTCKTFQPGDSDSYSERYLPSGLSNAGRYSNTNSCVAVSGDQLFSKVFHSHKQIPSCKLNM